MKIWELWIGLLFKNFLIEENKEKLSKKHKFYATLGLSRMIHMTIVQEIN